MRHPIPATIALSAFLDRSANESPDQTALFDGKENISFAAVKDGARALALSLMVQGVRPTDRVFVVLDNCSAFALAFWAVQYAAAVFVPVNPATTASQLAWLIDDSTPRVVIAQTKNREVIDAALAAATTAPVLIWSTPERFETDNVTVTDRLFPVAAPDDLAAIIYTSGSTSNPKGVMLSQRNMVTAACSVASYLGYEPSDRVFCAIPFTFDYGLHQITMTTLVKATLIVENAFAQPLMSLHRLATYQATVFPLVPTIAALISPFAKRFDFSRIRIVTSTASAFNTDSIDAMRAMFPKALVFSMYGLTECHRCTYLDPAELDRRKASIGKAIPLTQMWVEDEDGNRIKSGGSGELVIRGDTVMLGYWNNSEATRERLFAGDLPGERYLHTGDLVQLDEEGFAYFIGRRDEMLKVRGQKVAPLEVEAVIATHPAVSMSAIVGIPDAVTDTRLIAFVELRLGEHQDESDLQAFLGEHLKPHQRPAEIRFSRTLPKSPNGKIDKKRLKAEASENTSAAA